VQHEGSGEQGILCEERLKCSQEDYLSTVPCCDEQDTLPSRAWKLSAAVPSKFGFGKSAPLLTDSRMTPLGLSGVPSTNASSAEGSRLPETSSHKNLWPLSWLDVLGYIISCIVIFIAAGAISC
jgi:hypothetical protein